MPRKVKQLPEICKQCGSKRVDIGGYGNRICPLNCDSPYMMHNQITRRTRDGK